MPAVLAPGQGARRVMVIEGDPEQRSGLAAALRKAGMTVATADDVRVARRLIQRFVPHVVVADLETVAPDFEPLRPVLDDLLAASDDVAVVLLDDQQRGETAECVRRSFEKPTLPERVAEAVAELIAASR
jgi:DNA-binding NtrC family response regulator